MISAKVSAQSKGLLSSGQKGGLASGQGETNIHIGDIVSITSKVVEGDKTRNQVFEGILIRLRGRAENSTLTVRKIGAGGIGVERTWPLDSKSIVKIDVKKKTRGVRRSKLYYLRDAAARA